MPAVPILASKWQFQASNDGTNWTTIKGLNSFTLSMDRETADITTFNSEGHAEHIPATISKTITAEGKYLIDDEGVRDPGQELVENLANSTGPAAIGYLRIIDPEGTPYVFRGSFVLGDIGGGLNEATSWGFEFTRTGANVI